MKKALTAQRFLDFLDGMKQGLWNMEHGNN